MLDEAEALLQQGDHKHMYGKNAASCAVSCEVAVTVWAGAGCTYFHSFDALVPYVLKHARGCF